MLEAVRLSLRLTNEAFDDEIADFMEACKLDLKLAGVVKIEDDDPLILRAVTLYSKGHFGFADVGEKYLNVYESLKTPLRLAGDLAVGGDVVDE
jgi:hypothetical protein